MSATAADVIVVVSVSAAAAADDDDGGGAVAVYGFLTCVFSSVKRNPFLSRWVTNFSNNLALLRYRKANLCIEKYIQIIKFVSQNLPCLYIKQN